MATSHVEPLLKPAVEETRSRILAATRAIYATKGSRGTTTREIAEHADVNEATLFRHFGTKSQLISAMLDHYAGVAEFGEVLARVRALPTIDAQLRELGLASIGAIRRKADLIRVSMAEEVANPEGHSCAWRAPIEARRRIVEFFAEKVENGELCGDPDWLARSFMSVFFAFVMAGKIWAGLDADPESAVSLIVDLFLNGARIR
jgi:AcrR family transcriptional regulator